MCDSGVLIAIFLPLQDTKDLANVLIYLAAEQFIFMAKVHKRGYQVFKNKYSRRGLDKFRLNKKERPPQN